MRQPCERFDSDLASGEIGGEEQDRWRRHLAGCAVCREQVEAEALLRGALAAPPPELAAGFEGRLRRRLERRAAGKPSSNRHPGRLSRSGLWVLAAYATSAAAASVVIISRLPWQSLTPSPALVITLAALALLSPLVLLDRLGIVRPPG